MVKRYQQEFGVVPQNLSTGAAVGISSLADRLESFARETDRLTSAIGSKRGYEEGSQVKIEKDEQGIAKQPQKKKAGVVDLLVTGGAKTAAYNRAIQDGYFASLETDVRTRVAEMELKHQDSLINFNEEAEGFISGVVNNVDPVAREATRRFIDERVASSRLRIQEKTLRKNKEEANASRFAAIDVAGIEAAQMARSGDMRGSSNALLDAFATIDGMVQSHDLATDKAAEMKRGMEREATEQTYRFELDKLNPDQALQRIEEMKNTVPKGWTPDEWDLFTQSSEADVLHELAKAKIRKQEISLDALREISNLKIQAKTGTGVPSQIIKRTEELFNSGAIKEQTRTSILTNLTNSQKTANKEAESMARVNARLGDDNSADPVSQKDVDYVWNTHISPSLQDKPMLERNAHIEDFVLKTRLIPTEVRNRISGALNSDNIEAMVEAVELIDRIENIRGMPDDLFPTNEKVFAEIAVNLSKNMEPAEAVKIARANTSPNDKARIDFRKEQLKNAEINYKKEIDGYFNPILGSTRITPIDQDRITQEFKILYDQFYIAGNDNPAEKAAKFIKRNWGVSTAIGDKPRVMKYPVEHFYAINSMDPADTAYIGKQLYNDIKKSHLFNEAINPNQIYLIANRHTAETAALGQPEYIVQIVTDNGLEELPDPWKPDREAEVQRRLKEHGEIVEQLRAAPPESFNPLLNPSGLY